MAVSKRNPGKNIFSCFSEVCSSEFVCLDFVVVVVVALS